MRAYMYNYGYNDCKEACRVLDSLSLNANPCSQCSTCLVNCTMGFDVAEKIKDIARLQHVPHEFLV